MRKLVSANFMRLWKNKCFFGCLFVMLCIGVMTPVSFYLKRGADASLENGFYSCSPYIVILLSLFSALFVGAEYSDGTIRNKIIVGHRRKDIYLANLFTSMAAGLLLYAVYFIVYLCVGTLLLGFFRADIRVALLFMGSMFGIMALFTFAFSALFTMAAMLFSNKAGAVALCILGTVFLVVFGIYLHGRLSAPKMLAEYSLDVDGVMQEEMEENPDYLEGTKREVYQFLLDFLPGGQVVQCVSMEIINPVRLPVYSVIVFLLVTAAGLLLFNYKDIR